MIIFFWKRNAGVWARFIDWNNSECVDNLFLQTDTDFPKYMDREIHAVIVIDVKEEGKRGLKINVKLSNIPFA